MVEETLTTLAILFPGTTAYWLRANTARTTSEPSYDTSFHTVCRLPLRPNQREIKYFHHWHDRLVVLKRVLDESEAKRHLTLLSRARRDCMRWYVGCFIGLHLLASMCLTMVAEYQLHGSFMYPSSIYQDWDMFVTSAQQSPLALLQIASITSVAIFIVVVMANEESPLRSLFLLGHDGLQNVKDQFWWAAEMVTMTALYVLGYLPSKTVSKAL